MSTDLDRPAGTPWRPRSILTDLDIASVCRSILTDLDVASVCRSILTDVACAEETSLPP